MEIEITPGAVDVIVLRGTIDALTAPKVIEAFAKHINDGHPYVVVDFANVEFMSSAGLRALLASVKEARGKGGDLRIAAVPATIEKILKMAGFYTIIKVYASAAEAQASFEK